MSETRGYIKSTPGNVILIEAGGEFVIEHNNIEGSFIPLPVEVGPNELPGVPADIREKAQEIVAYFRAVRERP